MSDTTASATSTVADLVTRYVAAVNDGDTDELDEILSPDFVDHHLPPDLAAGIEGAKTWTRMLHDALQLRIELLDLVEGVERAAVRARITGRHVGEFAGMPATGRAFDASYLSIERIDRGRIAERWELVDQRSLAAQLSGDDIT